MSKDDVRQYVEEEVAWAESNLEDALKQFGEPVKDNAYTAEDIGYFRAIKHYLGRVLELLDKV